MLDLNKIHVDYDGFQVLRGLSLHVGANEITCILGPNGAGKSTAMNAITRLVPVRQGGITFLGTRIDNLATHKIVELGIAHVLERRHVFPYLSVRENLLLGSFLPRAKKLRARTFGEVFERLPMLQERLDVMAGALSGGQQQQLAIARGLMSRPKLLLLDEPFLGLSPVIMDEIETVIRGIRESGVSVLMIEQNADRALSIADNGYVLESGSVAVSGPAPSLLRDPRVVDVYLGSHA